MSTPLDPIAISGAGAITIPNMPKGASVGSIRIVNESPYLVKYFIGGTPLGDWIPAWAHADIDLTNYGFNGNITAKAVPIYTFAASPAFSLVITTYAPGEPMPAITTYLRQATIGNTTGQGISTNVTAQQANELVTVDGTQFIYLTEASGVMSVIPQEYPADTGASIDLLLLAKLTGTGLFNKIIQSIVASNIAELFMKLQFIGGFVMGGVQKVIGTGPGTFSHSLGVTPSIVLPTCTNGSVANNPVSSGVWTSSAFNIYCPAGTDWYALIIAS